jgi:hypothetical protein
MMKYIPRAASPRRKRFTSLSDEEQRASIRQRDLWRALTAEMHQARLNDPDFAAKVSDGLLDKIPALLRERGFDAARLPISALTRYVRELAEAIGLPGPAEKALLGIALAVRSESFVLPEDHYTRARSPDWPPTTPAMPTQESSPCQM